MNKWKTQATNKKADCDKLKTYYYTASNSV